jgi:ferredoxin--NADP+ reductase
MNQYVKLTLQNRTFFTDDLRVLSFKPEKPIDYNPGEYATLGVRTNGGLTMRQYSILSHPSEPTIRFFIERVDGGELSPRLFDLDLGDSAWMWNTTLGSLGSVKADFHFISATVTGISPFMPILKERSRKEEPEPTFILHGASYPEEFGNFEGQIGSIGSGYSPNRKSWLTYVQTISRPSESKRWSGEVGRVEDVLRKHLDDSGFKPEETAGFAAGHPKMVEKAHGIYERTQIDSIHEERYFGQ